MAQTELVLSEQGGGIVRHEQTVLEIIANAARDPQVDTQKLGALLAMKERIDARDAELAFNQAMARLQPKLPRVRKSGSIDLGRGKPIPFAKWEDVDAAIRPLLTQEGLCLSFESKATDKGVLLTAVLSHIQGHSRSSEMQLPADSGPGRNALQAIGSARSYGKRYLACDMLNIVTAGQDDDARATGFITDKQVQELLDILTEIGRTPKQFATAMDVASINEIQAKDFKRAMQLLEEKRRAG